MSSPHKPGASPGAAEERLVCLIGPPKDPSRDAEVVRALLSFRGAKAVCGGTTAAIVSRVLDREPRVRFETRVPGLPPAGELPGIDLVCEGILTLNRVLELLTANNTGEDGHENLEGNTAIRESGALSLYRLLCRAQTVKILFGEAENPVRQAPPAGFASKRRLVESLRSRLLELGKNVTIEIF
jgi:hypothetical protein